MKKMRVKRTSLVRLYSLYALVVLQLVDIMPCHLSTTSSPWDPQFLSQIHSFFSSDTGKFAGLYTRLTES